MPLDRISYRSVSVLKSIVELAQKATILLDELDREQAETPVVAAPVDENGETASARRARVAREKRHAQAIAEGREPGKRGRRKAAAVVANDLPEELQ